MKLLIADDHTLFRDALVQYIERSDPSSCVKLAKDFYEAMDILSKDSVFDLIILDLGMPGMAQMEGFRILKKSYPDIPFALMSGIAEPHQVREAIELGAVGYFPKTLSGKSLILAIKQVLGGRIFIPEEGGNKGVMPAYYTDDPKKGRQSLQDLNFTPRELEVLSYLVGGATNKEIARALELQVVTIKLHVRGICRKLKAQNRTQAALIAQEFGIKPLTVTAL